MRLVLIRLSLLFLISVLALSCVVSQTALEGEEVYIPEDLADAHRQLKGMLSPRSLQEMRNGTEDEMARYHHGLGTSIRNNWGLWEGSRLSDYFNKLGIYHPDDMSGIILRTFWCDLNGESHRLDERIKHYQEYWQSMETPIEGSPKDGAEIDWVITQGEGKGTIHLGISKSDSSFWRYEYGSGKRIEPARPKEVEDLGDLIETWDYLETTPEYLKK